MVEDTTHAIIHRLRRRFLEPTNVDVLAFHEGYADVIALFQRFSYRDVVSAHMKDYRGDLRRGSLLDLAHQFGQALNRNRALRSALDEDVPDPTRIHRTVEPHDRGAILLAALFDGFISVYEQRIADLRRIATGGTGVLPHGDIHPDLAGRFVGEATKAAQSVLNMCVRAFDYLPPVDVTFGDFLRALVTADYDFVPVDKLGQLEAIIDGFRRRGIYPDNVVSLAVESLLWPEGPQSLPRMDDVVIRRVLDSLDFEMNHVHVTRSRRQTLAARTRAITAKYASQVEDQNEILAFANDDVIDSFQDNKERVSRRKRDIAYRLYKYAEQNAPELGLDPGLPISVEGFHATVRSGPSGQPSFQLVVQYVQRLREPGEVEALAGLRFRGGTTALFDSEGHCVRVIAKPVRMTDGVSAWATEMGWANPAERRAALIDYVGQLDLRDPLMSWSRDDDLNQRMRHRASLRGLHSRRAI